MATHASLPPGRPACDQPGSLIEATRHLLKRDERTHEQLSKELNVPFHWLRSFMAGEIEAPSVNRVQYIYEKLSGSRLVF